MKKYVLTLLLGLITGIFLFNVFLNQYTDYNGISVSNLSENVSFIQVGAYSTLESMEKNTLSLQNYIYNEENNLYYVYVGISQKEESIKKIQEYYKKLGYNTIVKEFTINNKSFLVKLQNYDELIKNTTDSTALSSIINETLISYEEEVINGDKD